MLSKTQSEDASLNEVKIASGYAIDIAILSGSLFCVSGHILFWLVANDADAFSQYAIYAYPIAMLLALVMRILFWLFAHKNGNDPYRLYEHQRSARKLLFCVVILCTFCGGIVIADFFYYLIFLFI